MKMLRGDHIVPSFEEIWPSRAATKRVKRGIEYYIDVSTTQYIYIVVTAVNR